MPQFLHELISGGGFERYRPGLESRFRANGLVFTIKYSKESPIPKLGIRLEGSERMAEMLVWEAGYCDVDGVVIEQARWSHRHVVLESEADFHRQVAVLFLFVTGQGEITTE
jgi:hypothetical protein